MTGAVLHDAMNGSSDSDYASDAPADLTREITRSTVVMDIKAEGQEHVIELDCEGSKLKMSALSEEDKGIWKSAIQDVIRARISAAVTEVEAPPKPPATKDDPSKHSTLDSSSRAGLMAALSKQGPAGGGDRGGLLAAIAKRGGGGGGDRNSTTEKPDTGGRGGLLAAIAKRGSGGDRGSTTEKPDSGARGGLLAAIQARKSTAARESTGGDSPPPAAAASPPSAARGGLLAAIQARKKESDS